jgi:hypothetical protein
MKMAMEKVMMRRLKGVRKPPRVARKFKMLRIFNLVEQ